MLADTPQAAQQLKGVYPNFAKWLKRVPKHDYWCFVIDVKDHTDDDPNIYDEDEPGYLNAMLNSLEFIFTYSTLLNEITPQLIRALHKKAIAGVQNLNCNTTSYRHYEGLFGFSLPQSIHSNCSVAGLNEIKKEWCKKKEHYSFVRQKTPWGNHVPIHKLKAIHDYNHGRRLFWGALTVDSKQIEKNIKKSIKYYKRNLERAETDFDKLYSIARFIHHLNLLHPFDDGNIRTFAYLLCPMLLIQNGFFPVAFYNPNCFDGFSSFELAVMLHDSLSVTAEIYHLPYPNKAIEDDMNAFFEPTPEFKRGREMLFHYKKPYKDPETEHRFGKLFKRQHQR